MPLVDVTHASLPDATVRRLAQVLPDLVAAAVDCPEEPWTGPPLPGDLEIRFRGKGPFDVGQLDCVIEVRTKLYPSRQRDRRDRADRLHAAVVAAVPEVGRLGVWLVLHEGAWAQ